MLGVLIETGTGAHGGPSRRASGTGRGTRFEASRRRVRARAPLASDRSTWWCASAPARRRTHRLPPRAPRVAGDRGDRELRVAVHGRRRALEGRGADFIAKPIDVAALLRGAVGRVAERRALKTAFDEARAWLVGRIVGAALIGDSPPMRRLLARIDGVAQSDSAILITGENGTGKDIVARPGYARYAARRARS